MRSRREQTQDDARQSVGRATETHRAPKVYSRPELTSYGNLVDLTRASGGGDPDGLFGTIGT